MEVLVLTTFFSVLFALLFLLLFLRTRQGGGGSSDQEALLPLRESDPVRPRPFTEGKAFHDSSDPSSNDRPIS